VFICVHLWFQSLFSSLWPTIQMEVSPWDAVHKLKRKR
jgi:hypothetical protein